ncbi:hypothetical protein [Sulfurisphaera javensis]|uniref:hypothetical protein n=1 Tax=Sulfurisphaera javensis TaxID=2049879 RepID=UPI0034E8F7B2
MNPSATSAYSPAFHIYLYEYNGSTIVGEKVFNEFTLFYSISYNNNSALLMESFSQSYSTENITLLFTNGKSVSFNVSSINYVPIIKPTHLGVLVAEIHNIVYNLITPTTPSNTVSSTLKTSSSNSSLILINWNGNVVYNKTLNLAIAPFDFETSSFGFSSSPPIGSVYAIVGNYFYVINLSYTGITYPNEYTSELVKIYIPNGEISSVLNISNNSHISLLPLDNNLVIIKSENNTLSLYSIGMGNNMTLLYKIPLKYKTITRMEPVPTPQGIEMEKKECHCFSDFIL